MSELHRDPDGHTAPGYPVQVIGDPDPPLGPSGAPQPGGLCFVVGDRFVVTEPARGGGGILAPRHGEQSGDELLGDPSGNAYIIDVSPGPMVVVNREQPPVIFRRPRRFE